MIEYPIMFADLRSDSQVALLEHMGVKHQKDMNWDVMPICVIPRPETDSDTRWKKMEERGNEKDGKT